MKEQKPSSDLGPRTEDVGPLGRFVDEKVNPADGAPAELPEQPGAPTPPRAVSGEYAEGTAEHDDDREI